jgi:sterol desaturase/sphingolipid hydroxylase (fatty acid hydroxylase superfamily)
MLEKIEEIRDTLLKYLEVRVELVKTETQEKVEEAVVQGVYLVVLLLLGSLVGLFLLLILAELLNEWLESRYLGYLAVLGILLVKIVLWILARKFIQNLIRRLLHRFFNHA